MKKFLLIVALTATHILFAQEGAYMEMKISSSLGAAGNIKTYLSSSGQRSEFEMNIPQMPGGGIHFNSIIRKDKPNTIVQLNDANKTYTETEVTDQPKDKNTYTVKKMGVETVSGYKCIRSLITSNNGENTDMWTSKDILYYEQYNKMNRNNPKIGSSSREKAMKNAGAEGFPVKMIVKTKEGDFTMELTKAEKKDFASSMFEIPAGYTKSGLNPTITPADIQNMTPEERMKYIEEMKKMYGQ